MHHGKLISARVKVFLGLGTCGILGILGILGIYVGCFGCFLSV